MIVSDKLKYVYIAPSKTASHSINEWLIKYHWGEYRERHHQYKIEDKYKDYLLIVSLRNPLNRIKSVLRYWGIKRFVRHGLVAEFYLFWNKNKLSKKLPKANDYEPFITQMHYIKLFRKICFVRFSRLKEDLEALPFARHDFNIHLNKRNV